MPLMGHLPKNEGLHIQVERVERWYNRILELDSGERNGPISLEMSIDEFLVFFIFCYHLKDYLIKETDIPKREIEAFITQTPSLAICADIANGTKHFGIDDKRNPRSGEDFRMREYVTVSGEKVGLGLLISLENGNQRKVIDLAKECIDQWAVFLSSHPPKSL